MRMTDIVSNMDLAMFPQIALFIFLGVFAAVSVRAMRKRHTQEFAEAAQLPLQDAPTSTTR